MSTEMLRRRIRYVDVDHCIEHQALDLIIATIYVFLTLRMLVLERHPISNVL